MNRTFPVEFSDLMQQYKDTAAGLGDDHPITRRLWLLVEATAPEWFRQEMLDMAQQMNLIPAPSLCDENGDAVFTLAQLAEQLGVTVEEAEASFNLMVTERRALGLPIPKPVGGPIHRLH